MRVRPSRYLRKSAIPRIVGAAADASGLPVPTAAKCRTPRRRPSGRRATAVCDSEQWQLALGSRYRLNPGGDRQANNAIHAFAIIRAKHQPDTRAYLERRSKEGKTRREALRSLKGHMVQAGLRFLAIGLIAASVSVLERLTPARRVPS